MPETAWSTVDKNVSVIAGELGGMEVKLGGIPWIEILPATIEFLSITGVLTGIVEISELTSL